jgi:lipid II:glycine glycyltransferase (peptidoglycan interpeptide bridge formation enzyme)
VSIHVTNPLSDNRWDGFVANHPRASVFHKRGWLEALRLTYGYKPFAVTRSAPGEALKDALVLCQVSSWITGARAVSLPFTDHCEPLVETAANFSELLIGLRAELSRQGWKYIELRPLTALGTADGGVELSSSYWFHELDIRSSSQDVLHRMHRDSIQRKIQRAEREGLSYEVGSSPELLNDFYQLLLITRRRLQILPQPLKWFRNLVETMGNDLLIWVARHNKRPIASILTLRHKQSVVYKYGCSNHKFHNVGGIPFLFWKLIEQSKETGVDNIDFGRSDLENKGLATFKDRFGACRRRLNYYRYFDETNSAAMRFDSKIARHVVAVLPNAICRAAGRLLYRHVG